VTSDWLTDSPEGRQVLLDVVAALEAVVVALQVARAGSDPGYALGEAVRRVVAVRRQVEGASGRRGG
jgi:hypothetical protein